MFLLADLGERKNINLINRLINPSHRDEKIWMDEV